MKTELLAPVHSLSSLIIAHESGADAFYLGAPYLNARRRSGNVSLNEIKDMARAARSFNKKMYLAMNVLVKDREFSIVKKICGFSLLNGIDALIVQDLGVLSFINKYFPEIPIHASTQLFAYSLNSHLMLAELGVKRVVLPRELNMEEIAFLNENSPLELEVFIHGAMCFSFSGMCLFSDYVFGKSGNRGVCSQLCRFPFRVGGNDKDCFSMKDLFSAKGARELRDMGISSLKIEGRMRGAAYLKEAVSFYRALLDGKTVPEKTLFTREKGKGYFYSCQYGDVVGGKAARQTGVKGGTVKEVRNRSVLVSLNEAVFQKDTIRILKGKKNISVQIGKINSKKRLTELFLYPAEKIKEIRRGDVFHISGRDVSPVLKPKALKSQSRYERYFDLILSFYFTDKHLSVKGKFANKYLVFNTRTYHFNMDHPETENISAEKASEIFRFHEALYKVVECRAEGEVNGSHARLKCVKRLIKDLMSRFILEKIQERLCFSSRRPARVFSLKEDETVLYKEIKNIKEVEEHSSLEYVISWFHIKDWEKAFLLKDRIYVKLPAFYSPKTEWEWMEKANLKNREGFRFCLTHWSQVNWYAKKNIGYYHLYQTNSWTWDFYRHFGLNSVLDIPYESSCPNIFGKRGGLFKELMIFRTSPPFPLLSWKKKVFMIENFPEYSILLADN